MTSANSKYSGSVGAAKWLVSNDGIRGLYHGVVPTLYREGFGCALYFGAYESLKRHYYPLSEDGKREDPSLRFSILAGAVAGASYWGSMFPFDVIKTQMQTDNMGQRRGMLSMARLIFVQ